MTTTESFTIPGKPVSKGRPRFAKGRTYTDPKTANYEALVGWYARAANITKLDGAVCMRVAAYWTPPKAKMRKGEAYKGGWRASRPDADNILKAVLDGLNGIAYEDDAQVVMATVEKSYAAEGEEARVEVQVMAL